jgi:hypothetical protein
MKPTTAVHLEYRAPADVEKMLPFSKDTARDHGADRLIRPRSQLCQLSDGKVTLEYGRIHRWSAAWWLWGLHPVFARRTDSHEPIAEFCESPPPPPRLRRFRTLAILWIGCHTTFRTEDESENEATASCDRQRHQKAMIRSSPYLRRSWDSPRPASIENCGACAGCGCCRSILTWISS